MDKLLAWSIAQQSGDKEAIEKVGQPDMKALNQIFGGVDEPALMKQSIQVVENPQAEEEDKEVALENFEMLIENLDNANNIENLKLWESIIKLLGDSTPMGMKTLAASIIGIAVQNNPQCQGDFLKYDGFKALIENSGASNTGFRLKVLFAISSVVRNNKDAIKYFNKYNGWSAFETKADNHKVDIRLLSVLSSILTNESLFKSEIEPKLHELKLVNYLINHLVNDNITCMEKALNVISQLINLNFKFNDDELTLLSTNMSLIKHLRQDYLDDFKNIETITK